MNTPPNEKSYTAPANLEKWVPVVDYTQSSPTPTVAVPVDHEYFVGGFAVTHCVPYDADIDKKTKLPIFKKWAGSTTYYCAGYYCVEYDKGWRWISNVTLSTLTRYSYRGPFHTMEKAMAELTILRKIAGAGGH